VKSATRYHSFLYKLLLIILILSISGCGTVGGAEDQDISLTDGEPPRLMGFATNPAGEPVYLADVGGEDYTTKDGIASGDFLDYQDGWIPITALGHATGFGRPFGESEGSSFFVATLTPYSDVVVLEGGEERLLAGSKDEILWTAAVEGGMFSGEAPLIGLTALDPYAVDAFLAPYPEAPHLYLRTALALEAFDQGQQAIGLSAGAVVPITLSLPSPLSEEALFARFDPDAGEWKTVDLRCTAGDGNLYNCQLDFLDPLIGVFDDPGSYALYPAGSGGARLSPQISNNYLTFQQAWMALRDWLKSKEADGEVDVDDPDLRDLVEDIVDAAKDFAKNNRTEEAKRLLGQAVDICFSTGQGDLASDLMNDMGDVSEDLGKEALKETKCEKVRRVSKIAEQIFMLDGDMGLVDQLIEKAKELAKDCDLWEGTVNVNMTTASQHPAGLPMESQGGGNWSEIHQVTLYTNIDDYAMHGMANINLIFPPVTYVKEKPCRQEIKMVGGGSGIEAGFEGSFDGYTIVLDAITPPSQGGTIQQSWRFQKKEDDKCEQFMSKDYSLSPYYSIILHGLSSDSPPIDYYQILDTGASSSSGGGGIPSFGSRANFGNPDPDLGIYPFNNVIVSWHFNHTQMKLPLEQE